MEKIVTFIAENKKRELEEAAKNGNEHKLPDPLPQEKKEINLITSIPRPSV
jgi:hypothetical protein